MTTATRTFSFNQSDTTTLNAWIANVKTLLTTTGILLQTSDTGQLDPTGAPVTWVTTASNNYGYMIFKFNDTLAATAPIYIKLNFMNSSAVGSGLFPQVQVSVASSTNGAGTLTGAVFGPIVNNFGATTPSTGLISYACHTTDGTFSMVLGQHATTSYTQGNSVASLIVDRARASDGTASTAGYLCEANSNAQGTNTSQSRSMYGGAPPVQASAFVPALVPNSQATGSSESGNVNVFKHYMMVPGVRSSLGSLTYFAAEFSELATVTVTVLGAVRTFLPVGNSLTHWSSVSNLAHCGMIRWE